MRRTDGRKVPIPPPSPEREKIKVGDSSTRVGVDRRMGQLMRPGPVFETYGGYCQLLSPSTYSECASLSGSLFIVRLPHLLLGKKRKGERGGRRRGSKAVAKTLNYLRIFSQEDNEECGGEKEKKKKKERRQGRKLKEREFPSFPGNVKLQICMRQGLGSIVLVHGRLHAK